MAAGERAGVNECGFCTRGRWHNPRTNQRELCPYCDGSGYVARAGDTPSRLFHFTCDHGHDALGNRGELRPVAEHPFLHIKVVWLTTESTPDRASTGLGMNITRCDRMKYRYVVTDLRTCHPWLGSPERDGAPPDAVEDLELLGDPEHWWITDEPTKARLG